MQNKKVTMLAAVLAVTIIAMAGVGYAAVTYKATTTNDNNSMDSTYIVLSQGQAAKYSENFLADLYFDTDTKWEAGEAAGEGQDVSTYTPVFTGVYNEGAQTYTAKTGAQGEVLNAALISNALTLTVKQTNNKDQYGTLNIAVQNVNGASKTTPTFNSDLIYYMVISGNGINKAAAINQTNGTCEITEVPIGVTANDEKTYNVQLVVTLKNGVDTCTKDSTGFATTAESPMKTVFSFSLEATA
jgi:hypothetical protein